MIRRKAIVVAAVKGGLLSVEEACGRYSLTIEEYLSWQAAVDRHGLAGLRTTKIQKYALALRNDRSGSKATGREWLPARKNEDERKDS